MEIVNEEKSLVKVDNSIFAKMRRFFHGLFSKKKNVENIEVVNSENVNEVKVEKQKVSKEVYTEPKLFNYDNPQYDYDSTLGKKPILNLKDEENVAAGQINFEDTGISKYFTNDNSEVTQESTESINNSAEYEDDGYGAKDELEQKLMNYYASIKKVIQ